MLGPFCGELATRNSRDTRRRHSEFAQRTWSISSRSLSFAVPAGCSRRGGKRATYYRTTMYREMGMTYWLEKSEAEYKAL